MEYSRLKMSWWIFPNALFGIEMVANKNIANDGMYMFTLHCLLCHPLQAPFPNKKQSHPDLYGGFNSKVNFIRALWVGRRGVWMITQDCMCIRGAGIVVLPWSPGSFSIFWADFHLLHKYIQYEICLYYMYAPVDTFILWKFYVCVIAYNVSTRAQLKNWSISLSCMTSI